MAKRYVGVNATISEVKAELRRSGHAPLAGRLSKLSKRRNLAAHPDLSLAADISSALSQPSVPGSVSGMSDADDKSTGDHSTSNKIQVYNDDELECIKRNMKLAQVPAKSVKLQSEGALLQFNFDKQEAGLILGDKELTRFFDAIKQLDTKIDLLSAQSAHLDMEVAALQAKFAEQEAFLKYEGSAKCETANSNLSMQQRSEEKKQYGKFSGLEPGEANLQQDKKQSSDETKKSGIGIKGYTLDDLKDNPTGSTWDLADRLAHWRRGNILSLIREWAFMPQDSDSEHSDAHSDG